MDTRAKEKTEEELLDEELYGGSDMDDDRDIFAFAEDPKSDDEKWRPTKATRPYVQPRPHVNRHAPPPPRHTTIGMAMARMNKPFKHLSWTTPAVFRR